jgi:hypothetical protein
LGGYLVVAQDVNDARKKLIRVFTFLGGIYFFLHFLLPESAVSYLGWRANHEAISNGFIVVGAMALGLGIFNIVRDHGARCVFKRSGWFNSLALLLGLSSMLFVTTGQWINGQKNSSDVRRVRLTGEFAARILSDAERPPQDRAVPPLSARITALLGHQRAEASAIEDEMTVSLEPDAPASTSMLIGEVKSKLDALDQDMSEIARVPWEALGPQQKALLERVAQNATKLASAYSLIKQANHSRTRIHKLYTFLYDGLFNQLGSAMFALLGVYIGAAAYRAFRVRSLESGLMMATAVLVMLGQISLGESQAARAGVSLQDIRQWLLEVPNSAAFRAIRLGAGVAGLMLAIRMWLSIEATSFSSRER